MLLQLVDPFLQIISRLGEKKNKKSPFLIAGGGRSSCGCVNPAAGRAQTFTFRGRKHPPSAGGAESPLPVGISVHPRVLPGAQHLSCGSWLSGRWENSGTGSAAGGEQCQRGRRWSCAHGGAGTVASPVMPAACPQCLPGPGEFASWLSDKFHPRQRSCGCCPSPYRVLILL